MVTNSPLEAILDRLDRAEGLDDLNQIAGLVRDHYSVDHIVYYWVNSVGERFGAGTYSHEWVERYLEKDYSKIDPVVLGCFQRFEPTNWKDFDWSSKAAQGFMKDAIAHGIGSQGIAIPIRGPNGQYAVFTVSAMATDLEWEQFLKDNRRDLMVVAYEFNKKALEFERIGKDMSPVTLSPRETAAMTYIARGHSRAQAAQMMKISEHTLRVYIETARHKLGALNTTHAVARALNTGLIVG